jgi:rare lipoprotein A
VQAGAFAQAENAQRARARVGTLGSVQVTPISVRGAAIYRVRLGPVATVDEADRLLAKVMSSGCPEARIVLD